MALETSTPGQCCIMGRSSTEGSERQMKVMRGAVGLGSLSKTLG